MTKPMIEVGHGAGEMFLYHPHADAQPVRYIVRIEFVEAAHDEHLSSTGRQFRQRGIQRRPDVRCATPLLLTGMDSGMMLLQKRHRPGWRSSAICDEIGGNTEEIGLRSIKRPEFCGCDQPGTGFLHEIIDFVRIGDASRDECT
jgi:hypothetical protein